MDSFFSLFTDGYKNKEDICRWIVCPDHSRRCEKIFLFVWKSKYSSSSFGLYSMSLLDTCLPPEQTFRTVLFCSQRILTNYKENNLKQTTIILQMTNFLQTPLFDKWPNLSDFCFLIFVHDFDNNVSLVTSLTSVSMTIFFHVDHGNFSGLIKPSRTYPLVTRSHMLFQSVLSRW